MTSITELDGPDDGRPGPSPTDGRQTVRQTTTAGDVVIPEPSELAPGGGHADLFARTAPDLHTAPGLHATAMRVLDLALQVVICDSAGLLLADGCKDLEHVAATDPIAEKADQLRVQYGEVGCQPANWEQGSFLIRDTASDRRCPGWAAHIAEMGLRSTLSVRLLNGQSTIGAINLYARQPDRFTARDEAMLRLLARHASIAIANIEQASALRRAIDARTVIGQAQGLLMERFALTGDEAFAVLRRHSQNDNVKLRDVAERLVATRGLPGSRGSSAPHDGEIPPR